MIVNDVKDYCYCVLSERLLVFSVSDFVYDLCLDSLNFLYDWDLLNEGKITGNIRCLNDFMIKIIDEYRESAEKLAESLNMRLGYFDFKVDFGDLTEYLHEPEQFSKKIKRFCKKHLCRGKLLPLYNREYNQIGEFDYVKCLNLTGEELETVMKKLGKI